MPHTPEILPGSGQTATFFEVLFRAMKTDRPPWEHPHPTDSKAQIERDYGLQLGGFGIGPGWYAILRRCLAELRGRGYLDRLAFRSVCNNWGSLKLAFSDEGLSRNDLVEIAEIIEPYREESRITCEYCGDVGEQMWGMMPVLTLCETHTDRFK